MLYKGGEGNYLRFWQGCTKYHKSLENVNSLLIQENTKCVTHICKVMPLKYQKTFLEKPNMQHNFNIQTCISGFRPKSQVLTHLYLLLHIELSSFSQIIKHCSCFKFLFIFIIELMGLGGRVVTTSQSPLTYVRFPLLTPRGTVIRHLPVDEGFIGKYVHLSGLTFSVPKIKQNKTK